MRVRLSPEIATERTRNTRRFEDWKRYIEAFLDPGWLSSETDGATVPRGSRA